MNTRNYHNFGNKTSENKHTLLQKGLGSENHDMREILLMMEKLLHWASIIESSDDAIMSISADSVITSWNKGAQRLYGYTEEEVIGKPTSILMPPAKKDDFPKIMKSLHDGSRVEHYETKRMTKDGKVLDVSITISPIRDIHGNIIGASKIARDITERVEVEKRRDEFVSTASHELKTPITSQKIFGELLERQIDKKGLTELKPYIQKINAQTNRITNLVEDLLELSRVQSGRLRMENKRFLYDSLLKSIVEDARLTTNHRIEIHGESKKYVKGDSERIGQVLTNLLSNAFKYSPKAEKVIITLKTSETEIITAIQDFGIGIDKEHFEKIFERFYRVSDVNEKTYPGMGIGLHLSQEIIAHHHGKIWVESAKGKGSTFYFSLPIAK